LKEQEEQEVLEQGQAQQQAQEQWKQEQASLKIHHPFYKLERKRTVKPPINNDQISQGWMLK
jgi:hypothetical protein